MPELRWSALTTARRGLLSEFADCGVAAVHYGVAFANQLFEVWLVPLADAQRDHLTAMADGAVRVQRIPLAHGFSEQNLVRLLVTCQSQETIDRDYSGSWLAAIK